MFFSLKLRGNTEPPMGGSIMAKMHILADPGKATGCFTNTLVIN